MQTNTRSSGCSIWGDRDFPLRVELGWGWGRGYPVMPKILSLPLLLDVIPIKKWVLSPFFLVSRRPCFARRPHFGIKVSLISCLRQAYLPEWYSLYPLLPKMFPSFNIALLPLPGVDCNAPSPQTFVENPRDWGRIPLSSRKIGHFPRLKIPLTKQQFLCNHKIQASFIAAVIAVVSFVFNVYT